MSCNLKLTLLFLSLKGNLNFPGKKSEPMREKDLRADRPGYIETIAHQLFCDFQLFT